MANEVSEHQGPIIAIIGILFSSLIGFVTWWFKIIRKKIVDHINKSDNVTIPQIDKRISGVEAALLSKHVEYIKLFASIDKRLVLLESNSRDIKRILDILEDMSDKIDKRS